MHFNFSFLICHPGDLKESYSFQNNKEQPRGRGGHDQHRGTADAEVDLSYRWKKRAAVKKVLTTTPEGAKAATAGTKRKANQYAAGQGHNMADCWRWWMRFLFVAGWMAGWPVQGGATFMLSDL